MPGKPPRPWSEILLPNNKLSIRKIGLGYPTTNIIFEDTQTAVLFQNGREILRANMANDKALHTLITMFFSYRPEIVAGIPIPPNRS